MPKFPSILALAAVAGLTLAGCTSSPDPAPTDNRPVVLATFTVIADMAQVVAGDDLRVESVTRPGAEIHDYEPSPQDLRRGQGAQLILENGLGLETWFQRFTQDIDAPTVTLSEGVTPIPVASGEYTGRDNPHAWMSPIVAQTYVKNIVTAFSTLDPQNAAGYRERGEAYSRELGSVASELSAALETIPENRRFLATCEGAFSYLARDVGLDEGFLWGVNQENEGTPQQISGLIREVREREVPTIFCESTVNNSAQRQVAADSGAQLGGLLYVDSLSDGPPVGSYLDLLRHDAQVIAEGLTR
ncbi:metal ABC transporter substrate-binding protein [Mycetocola spongiae]|uniref:metal ABC transporter substrate-binding protein n=1 Tax=Mycetocola spongiae TaxID=2859226 RepID=UPI001CF3AB1B|nr:metal ABC transporter substrate-binding protein [Mycetocola spongiae]UCR88371.1 metal ABC transporter substrate-binding protein [Mycetocola spongiae]